MFKFTYSIIEKYGPDSVPEILKSELVNGFGLQFKVELELAFAPYVGLVFEKNDLSFRLENVFYNFGSNSFRSVKISEYENFAYGGFDGLVQVVFDQLRMGYTSFDTHPKLKSLIEAELKKC